MTNKSSIRWVFALKAEADPLIKEFKLKIIHKTKLFPVYRNDSGSHWLIISGVGCINSAAASVFLYQLSQAGPSTFWFNLGIAGCYSGIIGDIYIVDKITDQGSGRDHFPRPAFAHKFARQGLLTVAKPCKNLPKYNLIDMEGFAFFDVINRVSVREMVAIIKIISDNQKTSYSEITSKEVTELIYNNLLTIKKMVIEAEGLSKSEYCRLRISDSLVDVLSKVHFTSSQKIIVERIIRDWEAIFPDKPVLKEIISLKSANEIIRKLSNDLNAIKYDWVAK